MAFLDVLRDLWSFTTQAIHRKRGVSSIVPNNTELLGAKGLREATFGIDIGYQVFVTNQKLNCYRRDDRTTSGDIVTSLSYGELLTCLHVDGVHALVAKDGVRCWVEASGITSDSQKVFPVFEPYCSYRTHSDETTKLRKCISHHFRKESEYLESDEYVLYRLQRDGFSIPWEAMHLLPGKSWYQKLLNRRGVVIHTEPRTYAVIEYNNEGVFVYGYVTAVHPDQTICVESIGREEAGEFRVEQFSKVEWVRWRPVFITFS